VGDPDRLNDRTEYQRCFACGQRNPAGLQLVFWQEGRRIHAVFSPQERHQGFPGVLHGGVIASLLDETLGRTGALRREWLITGKLEIRYRRPAPIGERLHVWGEMARARPGAVEAVGAVERDSGELVADARGIFVRLPPLVIQQALAQYPEFATYWGK